MKPGDKFKLARKAKGVSRKEVMEEHSLSYDQINRAENNLNDALLRRLIEFYGPQWVVPEAWFLDGKTSEVPDSTPQEVLYPLPSVSEKPFRYQPGDKALLPLWRSVFAAEDGDCWYSEDGQEVGEIPALFLDADPGQFFLAQIEGRSLEDLAFTGDRLLVRRTASPPVHSLILALSPEGYAVCKVLRPGTSQPYQLCSVNPDCPNITDLTGWKRIGEVRAIFLASVAPPRPNIVWDDHRPIRVPST